MKKEILIVGIGLLVIVLIFGFLTFNFLTAPAIPLPECKTFVGNPIYYSAPENIILGGHHLKKLTPSELNNLPCRE